MVEEAEEEGSHGRHVGPIERRSAEEHVADERFNWRFTHQTDEEQLLDHLRTANKRFVSD